MFTFLRPEVFVRGRRIAVTCVLLGWMAGVSPSLAASALRVGPVFAERFPTVEVVLDPGAPGAALPAAADLTLVEDGRPTVAAQSVRTFAQSGHGLSVVVAVDVSGSMAGAPIAETKRALLSLLKTLGPQDRAALVSFADDVQVEAPFGSSPARLRAAAEGLKPRGRITEIYRALFKALSLFTAEVPGQHRLIVISDGQDEGTAYTLDDVIKGAQRQEVPVDAIGLTRVDPKYLSNLERLAAMTGGHYSQAHTEAELEGLVRRGVEQVRAAPVATFTVQSLPRDGQPHRLGVQWRHGGQVLSGEPASMAPPPAATPAPTPESTPKSPGGQRAWLLAAVAGGLLLLVLAAVVLAARRRRARQAQPSSQPFSSPMPPPPPQDPAADRAATTPAPPVAAAPMVESVPAPSSQTPSSRRKTQIRHEARQPEPGRPAAVLMQEEGNAVGSRCAIEKDPFWIGAEEGNDLRIEGDDFLSSNHACLRFDDGSLLLYDNHSTNGTFVNGERLTGVARPVGPGDRIRVGHTTFVVLAP